MGFSSGIFSIYQWHFFQWHFFRTPFDQFNFELGVQVVNRLSESLEKVPDIRSGKVISSSPAVPFS